MADHIDDRIKEAQRMEIPAHTQAVADQVGMDITKLFREQGIAPTHAHIQGGIIALQVVALANPHSLGETNYNHMAVILGYIIRSFAQLEVVE